MSALTGLRIYMVIKLGLSNADDVESKKFVVLRTSMPEIEKSADHWNSKAKPVSECTSDKGCR